MAWVQLSTSNLSKDELYGKAESLLVAMLADAPRADLSAAMATLCSLVAALNPAVSWVGFYRLADPQTLIVGPYVGKPATLVIPVTRGVCGEAARKQQTIVVADVHAHPDHIVCDICSRSEIVVPWFSSTGELLGVLDLDSATPSAFDEVDQKWLECLLGRLPEC